MIILGLFLFNIRTALIVAVTIPFALLFAFICLDWQAHSGESAVHRRHRFRNHRGRRGGDGREYLPRIGGAARPDHTTWLTVIRAGGARRGAAHLLRHRGDHRRLSPHLRADRAFRTAVPADGGHDVVRAAGLACCAL